MHSILTAANILSPSLGSLLFYYLPRKYFGPVDVQSPGKTSVCSKRQANLADGPALTVRRNVLSFFLMLLQLLLSSQPQPPNASLHFPGKDLFPLSKKWACSFSAPPAPPDLGPGWFQNPGTRLEAQPPYWLVTWAALVLAGRNEMRLQ